MKKSFLRISMMALMIVGFSMGCGSKTEKPDAQPTEESPTTQPTEVAPAESSAEAAPEEASPEAPAESGVAPE